MGPASFIPTLTAIASIAVAISSANAKPSIHVEKAQVRFLATSTFLRGTWGTNQDVFLAELAPVRKGEFQLVRLMDEYPNFFPPIPAEVLRSQSGTVLRVTRDPQCDRPFGEILLRTAPGDLMAILPERLGYQPALDRTPAPGTVLPCHRVLRR